MSEGIVTASYVGATILFILALGGLSNQETSRRGNIFGMTGMAIALIVTIATVTSNIEILIGGLLIGGSIGLILAKRVKMT
jgi:NAD(P) transhydrogenase subunit beta